MMSNDEKIVRERTLNEEEVLKETPAIVNKKEVVKKNSRKDVKVELTRLYELDDGNTQDILIFRQPVVEDIFQAEEDMKEDSSSSKPKQQSSDKQMQIEDLMIAQMTHQKKMCMYVASVCSGYNVKFFKELYADDFALVQQALSPFLGGL